MKITVKKIFSCIALLSAVNVFALETGGLINNDSKFANVKKDASDKNEPFDLKLDQKNTINLWLRAPLSEDGKSYFTTEGAFKSEYDASIADDDDKFKVSLDVNLFKLVLNKELDAGDLVFTAGRFFNADLSGLAYTQNADGVKFTANLPKISVSLFGAYTGLLNAKNITILEKDKNDQPDMNGKAKTLYVLANKYLVGTLTVSLPNLFASQTISAEGFIAQSLESKKFNRYYGTLALNGPLVPKVFYNLSSTFAFSKADEQDMETSNLSQASIVVYPGFKSMSIALDGLYASGEQGSFKKFEGFTSGTAVNSTTEAEYKELTKAGLAASIKPIPNLLVYTNGDLVFDACESIKYAGLQYSLGLNWQVLSDFSVGVSFGQYIAKDDADTIKHIGDTKTQIKINAAIAF